MCDPKSPSRFKMTQMHENEKYANQFHRQFEFELVIGTN